MVLEQQLQCLTLHLLHGYVLLALTNKGFSEPLEGEQALTCSAMAAQYTALRLKLSNCILLYARIDTGKQWGGGNRQWMSGGRAVMLFLH